MVVVTVPLWYPDLVWLLGGGITEMDVVVTGGGVWMVRVHGQLVMVMVVDVLTVYVMLWKAKVVGDGHTVV